MNLSIPIYESESDRLIDIEYRKCELEVTKAMNEYFNESLMIDLMGNVYTESEEEKKAVNDNKFIKVIKSIIDTMEKFFTNFIQLFKDIFSKKQGITSDDYFQSETAEMKFNSDYAKTIENVEKEVLKGRKIIQKISKSTGIDDRIVAEYCDKATNTVIDNTPAVTKTVAQYGLAKIVRGGLNNITKTVKTTGFEIQDEIEAQKKENIKNQGFIRKKKNQLVMVLNKMQKYACIGISQGTKFLNDVNKNKKKKK